MCCCSIGKAWGTKEDACDTKSVCSSKGKGRIHVHSSFWLTIYGSHSKQGTININRKTGLNKYHILSFRDMNHDNYYAISYPEMTLSFGIWILVNIIVLRILFI